jgi:hypothetical protein
MTDAAVRVLPSISPVAVIRLVSGSGPPSSRPPCFGDPSNLFWLYHPGTAPRLKSMVLCATRTRASSILELGLWLLECVSPGHYDVLANHHLLGVKTLQTREGSLRPHFPPIPPPLRVCGGGAGPKRSPMRRPESFQSSPWRVNFVPTAARCPKQSMDPTRSVRSSYKYAIQSGRFYPPTLVQHAGDF